MANEYSFGPSFIRLLYSMNKIDEALKFQSDPVNRLLF